MEADLAVTCWRVCIVQASMEQASNAPHRLDDHLVIKVDCYNLSSVYGSGQICLLPLLAVYGDMYKTYVQQ